MGTNLEQYKYQHIPSLHGLPYLRILHWSAMVAPALGVVLPLLHTVQGPNWFSGCASLYEPGGHCSQLPGVRKYSPAGQKTGENGNKN